MKDGDAVTNANAAALLLVLVYDSPATLRRYFLLAFSTIFRSSSITTPQKTR
jgi:hypothetical protein